MDKITTALQAAEHRLRELRQHYDGIVGGRIDVDLQLLADVLKDHQSQAKAASQVHPDSALPSMPTAGRFDRVRKLPDGSFEHSLRGQVVAGPVGHAQLQVFGQGRVWTVTEEVNQQLAAALKDMADRMELMLKDSGGCDHSVNVSTYGDAVRAARELLRITGAV
jgi:hypothetical protein